MGVEKFAGAVVKIEDEVVAKVTSFTTPNLTISTADITGSEDILVGGEILAQKFASIAASEVASMEGIVIRGNAGQSELQQAARMGNDVDIEWVGPNGYGNIMTGIVTGYQESRGTGDVAKFTASFQVNENTAITPGS